MCDFSFVQKLTSDKKVHDSCNFLFLVSFSGCWIHMRSFQPIEWIEPFWIPYSPDRCPCYHRGYVSLLFLLVSVELGPNAVHPSMNKLDPPPTHVSCDSYRTTRAFLLVHSLCLFIPLQQLLHQSVVPILCIVPLPYYAFKLNFSKSFLIMALSSWLKTILMNRATEAPVYLTTVLWYNREMSTDMTMDCLSSSIWRQIGWVHSSEVIYKEEKIKTHYELS